MQGKGSYTNVQNDYWTIIYPEVQAPFILHRWTSSLKLVLMLLLSSVVIDPNGPVDCTQVNHVHCKNVLANCLDKSNLNWKHWKCFDLHELKSKLQFRYWGSEVCRIQQCSSELQEKWSGSIDLREMSIPFDTK